MNKQSSPPDQVSRDTVCTCQECNHNLARDCLKLKCDCCKADVHSMILDGMIGYGTAHKKFEKDFKDDVQISIGSVKLEGNIFIPKNARGIVLFAHGSGSSRHSPRNKYVAEVLNKAGLATLLIDLLTQEEEKIDDNTTHLRFDIDFLAQRLIGATDWLLENNETKSLNIGYFGASTGAAAALVAASDHSSVVKAIVSRGGRPDLAGPVLHKVQSPTLLIVGGNDYAVMDMNQEAFDKLKTEKKMVIVPGATHLFEERGTVEVVARLAADWFSTHLGKQSRK
ncbi:Serine aminopeptidase, S33 [uncultured archaeon]|nr:Serine aminopeptidase, S33 [uncultured archaeon]